MVRGMKPKAVKAALEKYGKLFIGANSGDEPTRWVINCDGKCIAETEHEDFAELIVAAIEELRKK
jgi:hypothetical protein